MNLDDIRIPQLIESGLDGDIVIVGFPYDDGVLRNGGRIGAAEGPSSFRKICKSKKKKNFKLIRSWNFNQS
jgi:arginase family enzyme